jgi:hypothetical protein
VKLCGALDSSQLDQAYKYMPWDGEHGKRVCYRQYKFHTAGRLYNNVPVQELRPFAREKLRNLLDVLVTAAGQADNNVLVRAEGLRESATLPDGVRRLQR